jgi:hypothetical protein
MPTLELENPDPNFESLSPAAQIAVAKWLSMFARKEFSDLPKIMAPNVAFHSPVGLEPYAGHAVVCLMLPTTAAIFEDFRYHRVFTGVEDAALEFSAHIGGVELKGIHILHFNDVGEIDDIEKFVRPAAAAITLGNEMGSRIGPQIKALRERTIK